MIKSNFSTSGLIAMIAISCYVDNICNQYYLISPGSDPLVPKPGKPDKSAEEVCSRKENLQELPLLFPSSLRFSTF